MKIATYYKVEIHGITPPSEYIQNGRNFMDEQDAIDYLEKGWSHFREYLENNSDRQILHENIREKGGLRHYRHQVTYLFKGFTEVVDMSVIQYNLYAVNDGL